MPPGQPPKKGNAKMLIIIGAVVLAVLALAITGGVLLLNRGAQTAGTDPNTGGSTAPPGGSTAPPPLAVKPSDAVKSYLEALAAGQAETALSLGDTAPSDTSLLTDAVLAQSNKLAPITDINVPDVDDEYAYQVAASFKLGKQAVNEDFSVRKSGDVWKLTDTFQDVDLSFSRSSSLPMIVNGVQAKTTKLRLFPGAYQFTTGSPNISWGDSGLLVIQSPSDYPAGVTDLRPKLSAAGEKAFVATVTANVNKCLESNKIRNPGCPNNVGQVSGSNRPKEGTFKWEATEKDALQSMEPELDYTNEAVARVSYLNLGLKAEGQCDDGPCTLTQYTNFRPRVNMLTEPLKVTWS